MLRAVGADPGRCGYTPEQIEKAMGRLAAEGVHQESAGAEHMMHLLVERGDADAVRAIAHAPRPHPEVLRLRFDDEHAPIDGVPADLRAELIRVQLEHADGAVRRSGRIWLPFDPLGDPDLHRPYAFESKAASGRSPAGTGRRRFTTDNHHLLAELTWPEAEQRFREVDVALLPVGAIEQHGPHLPLDTDAWDAEYLARRVAAECSEPKPLALPLIPYGVSFHHEDFSGTIGVSNDALAKMVYDVGMSCARNGITKLIIINGHGGNQATLQFAAQMINRDAHIFTTVDTGETSDVDLDSLCETDNDVHAGEIETSTSLATRPHLVRMDLAEREVQSFSNRYLDFSARRSVEWYARTAKISSSGVLGDPTRATPEKGRQMWDVMVRNLVELIEHLKALTLEEIYERRY
jgi:creatinine amidohydrolase/Fe(II)-dependent formamide hydrolase-like protein